MASYAKLRQASVSSDSQSDAQNDDEGNQKANEDFHIAHCFDYIRQGILCAGDSTLEGNNSATYPGVDIPWGTKHRCKNWDAMKDWADENKVWKWMDVIGIL